MLLHPMMPAPAPHRRPRHERGGRLDRWCLALAALLVACVSSPTVGSIGVVLGRDAASRSVFVREVPETKGDVEPILLPGDELLMVEGHYVRELSTEDLRRHLRGTPGTKVKLTVVRGGEILRVEVARTSMKQSPLRAAEERLVE